MGKLSLDVGRGPRVQCLATSQLHSVASPFMFSWEVRLHPIATYSLEPSRATPRSLWKLRRASKPGSPRAGLLRHLLAALFIVPQTLPVAASVWVE